jgi:tRNA A-37 threonylcarbamoyl transferase component Bud32
MEEISADAYTALVRSCRVLEKDGSGEKVLLADDGLIIKIFRRKRLFSGALVYPYARRFSANAARLARQGILTVDIVKLGHCPQPRRDLVWYKPVAGDTLRDYCLLKGIGSVINRLARFVAELHDKGILFRSLHWGNIIVTDDLSLGLIDIADMRFSRRALSIKQRQRNFRHMLRYTVDSDFFYSVADEFWSVYQQAAQLSDDQCRQLRSSLSDNSADRK